jgi:hypothetical protein
VEEGLEPHEFIKESVEHHHHEEEEHHPSDGARRDAVISASTAAVLAVCAAIGSLLSGHAANQAILHQTMASDQWNFYQAKSTKGHIYEVGKEIIAALSGARGNGEKLPAEMTKFEQQIQKYDREKEGPKQNAEHLQAEAKHEFEQHHAYSLGVAAFQVGIVLASISIMVRYRLIWALSLLAGIAGVVQLIIGFLK